MQSEVEEDDANSPETVDHCLVLGLPGEVETESCRDSGESDRPPVHGEEGCQQVQLLVS